MDSRLATKQRSSQGADLDTVGESLNMEARLGTGRYHEKKGVLWEVGRRFTHLSSKSPIIYWTPTRIQH